MLKTPTEPAVRDARRDRLIGIGLFCAAVVCFSLLDTTAKVLSRDLPTPQIVWARYMSNVLLVAAVLNPLTSPGVIRTNRLGLQAIRSLTLFGSTAMNFVAVRYLQLAETVSIMFMTPLLVVLLAAPLLGEKIGVHRLAAIMVGFAGVLVVVRPGMGGMHPAAFLSVLGCVCYAFYAILTRKLSATDRAETTLFYSGMAGVVVLTPLLPLFWQMPATPLIWALMASMGVYAAVGHFMMIKAHHYAPAGVLSPFMYSQLIWMVLLGWFIFGDVPDHWTIAGALIVVSSGLYLLFRERRRST